jgi:hypothetical protein
MTLPTWDEIAANALEQLDVARKALSEARDWMQSDWAEGQGPADHAQRHKAEDLIRKMKVQVDPAKEALRRSTNGATKR